MCVTTLVTGAAGFIGFHLAEALLARGEAVVGIDNLNDYYSPKLKQDRIADLKARHGSALTFLPLDFAQHETLEEGLKSFAITRIAHLGAQAGVRYSIENPRAYAQSNLVGHLNMLELARSRGVAQMVYASSSSVYGGNTRLPFRVEDRTDRQVSLYAATKKANELMSETYAHLYRIPLTGLRKVFNGGDMRRDFTYIDDIIAGVVACLDRPPIDDGSVKAGGSISPHRLYNIGNSKSEELTRMIDLIEAACGKPAIREMHPMQDGDVKDTYADVSAIANDLGYAPTTPIEIGLPRFVNWYKAYHGL
jgi:UDP-glucuronate 4-epimerase